jgi:hypothetical protein
VSLQTLCPPCEIGWRPPLNGAGFRGLAEEQAALSRVATLVARGVPAGELFGAVTEEVARLLSAENVHLIRYEPDYAAPVLAAVGLDPARSCARPDGSSCRHRARPIKA